MALNETATRYAMVKYPGDGSRTDFPTSFVGGFINASYVKAYSFIRNPTTGAISDLRPETCTLVGSGPTSATFRVAVASPVASGRTVQIQRETPKGNPLVDFINGSMLTAENLDLTTTQAIHSIAEQIDQQQELVVEVGDTADSALTIAQEARTTANSANATAIAAGAKADTALARAINAESGIAAAAVAANNAQNAANNATQAANSATQLVQNIQGEVDAAVATANAASATANTASANANAIAGVANAANAKADAAVADVATATAAANNAVAVANAVDGKAQSALDTANAAASDVADAVRKTPTALQTINSSLKSTQELRSGQSVNVERTFPASGNVDSYVHNFLNADGSVRYSGIKYLRIAGTQWATNTVLWDGPNGSYVGQSQSGTITLGAGSGGVIRANGELNLWNGALGTETTVWRAGKSDGVQRWAQGINANGDLTLYSYNESGGGTTQVIGFGNRGTDSARWTSFYSARCYFIGIVDSASWVGGSAAGHSPTSYGTAAILCRGPWGGGVELQDGPHALKLWFDGGNQVGGFNYHTSGVFAGTALQWGLICKARGGFQALSSRHAKNIHGKNPYGLAEVLKVVRVLGQYKDQPQSATRLFFIAEQLRKHIPQMVGEADFDFQGQKLPTVDYDQGVVVAFQAIEDLYDLVSEAVLDFDARLRKLEG